MVMTGALGDVYSCFTHITVDEQEPNPWCLASPEADSQHRHDGCDGLVDHLGRSRDHPASKPRWFWGDFETPAYQPWPNVANEITNKTFQIGVITVISKL